jgi:hypothetical protein
VFKTLVKKLIQDKLSLCQIAQLLKCSDSDEIKNWVITLSAQDLVVFYMYVSS